MTLFDDALGAGRHHQKSSMTARRLFDSPDEARRAFASRGRRLLDVNCWSKLSGVEMARFVLFDATGARRYGMAAEPGDFVAIALPIAGLVRTDWVRIEAIALERDKIRLTVRPSHDPTRRPLAPELTAPFFTREAVNHFTLERRGPWLFARVEGRDECANVGDECENAQLALANRLLAEGGWGWPMQIPVGSPQTRQWERFTRRLVGLDTQAS
jgi:hypothetical protein